MITDNNRLYKRLRQEYNTFTFERFDYGLQDDKISIKYTFNLSDKYLFEPELTFYLGADRNFVPDDSFLEVLLFNLGMIELISYWKAACPPNIIIKPYALSHHQQQFWKKVYFHGLGEFYYINGIIEDQDSFVRIESVSEKPSNVHRVVNSEERVIVPVGGGKDSVVTLELLKDHFEVVPFIINPRKASLETTEIAGFTELSVFRVDRSIHPVLLELNKQGFLNGHTPFSAMVAFSSLLAAVFSNSMYVALSNESSANEPTVENGPNHQYSKSFEFESDFRDYVRNYITPDIKYFSFLRPLDEMGIASVFSRFPEYFRAFKSCNVGSKNNLWCGKCPKCLFTAIILSPFISREELVGIFGCDLFDNEELIPLLDSLAGLTPVKPFECVGTIDEVNRALVLAIRKYDPDLPALLKHYLTTPNFKRFSETDILPVHNFSDEHFLEDPFLQFLIKGFYGK